MAARRSYIYLLSVVVLIASGHYLAKYFSDNSETAWVWTALYYGVWMLGSITLVIKRSDLRDIFRRGKLHASLVGPMIFAAIALVGIFIPNIRLLQFDRLLFMYIIICLFNPFIEELYWRFLPFKFLDNKVLQFLVASVGFALGHPLILGVNSVGASGWPTLVGAFILGSCWWIYYYKRGSLRWPVFTHFLIDVFGLSAYLLANKVPLLI